jgi:hypothetical protein
VDKSAHRRRIILVWLLSALFWASALVLALLSPRAISYLSSKEGPLEHLTHGVLIFAAAWHAGLWIRKKSRREHLFLGLLCLLFFLEETNYLQVYIGFSTPGWLKGFTGRADDLNFHNTRAADILIPAFYMFYFLVLPLAGRSPRPRALCRKAGLGPLTISFSLAFIANALAAFVIERSGPASLDAGELFDLAAAVFLLVIALWRSSAFQEHNHVGPGAPGDSYRPGPG